MEHTEIFPQPCGTAETMGLFTCGLNLYTTEEGNEYGNHAEAISF